MNDNMIRGIRTAGQSLAGFVAAGGLQLVWTNYLSNHPDAKIDTTILFVTGLALTGVAGVVQNEIEDRTGHRLGPIPKDRKIGDTALGTGIGSKTA